MSIVFPNSPNKYSILLALQHRCRYNFIIPYFDFIKMTYKFEFDVFPSKRKRGVFKSEITVLLKTIYLLVE